MIGVVLRVVHHQIVQLVAFEGDQPDVMAGERNTTDYAAQFSILAIAIGYWLGKLVAQNCIF